MITLVVAALAAMLALNPTPLKDSAYVAPSASFVNTAAITASPGQTVGASPTMNAIRTPMISPTAAASAIAIMEPTAGPTASVFDDEGSDDGMCEVIDNDGNVIGKIECPEEPAPPSEGDTDNGVTENFNPGPCDEGYAPLPDGFDSPFTSDVIQELRIRVDDVEPLPVTRVGGNECAAWTSRFDARFAAVTCPAGYMCQMGIGHQLETLILGQGQRIRKVHGFTIRYIDSYLGDQVEPGTYAPFTDVPLPSDTESLNDACLFLLKANNWGENDVDDPSWDTVLIEESGFTCGPWTDTEGNQHEVPVISVDWDSIPNRGSGFGQNTNGGTSLADLNCNSATAAAAHINANITAGRGKVDPDDLRHPPKPGGGTYPNGWVLKYKESNSSMQIDVDALGWYRVDVDNGRQVTKGVTPSTKGFTAWCRL